MVPFKTCSLDCVYCQLGPTTERTIEREPYVSAEDIIADLRAWLEADGAADFITLAGSGEPTLNSEIGQVIGFVKEHTEIPLSILTNGTLFWDDELRQDCLRADLIIPDVDAGTPEVFERLNQPAPGLEFERMIEGLVSLRREFEGEIWAEVMLVEGINDSAEELRNIRRTLDRIEPEQVQVNTVVRPPATSPVKPLAAEQLQWAKELLEPGAVIIAPLDADLAGVDGAQATEEEVLSLLARRPCTLKDISVGLGVHRNEIVKYLTKMLGEGAILSVQQGGKQYYQPAQ